MPSMTDVFDASAVSAIRAEPALLRQVHNLTKLGLVVWTPISVVFVHFADGLRRPSLHEALPFAIYLNRARPFTTEAAAAVPAYSAGDWLAACVLGQLRRAYHRDALRQRPRGAGVHSLTAGAAAVAAA
jgi:hypothetical protein